MDNETAPASNGQVAQGCLKLILITAGCIGVAVGLGYLAQWLM